MKGGAFFSCGFVPLRPLQSAYQQHDRVYIKFLQHVINSACWFTLFGPSRRPRNGYTPVILQRSRKHTTQSWAHRSYKLSERSKAMSDPWFSERKEKSVERRANCKRKEFADRSKRSVNLKERSAKPHFELFALERCKVSAPRLFTKFCRHEILYVFCLFHILYKSANNCAELFFWKLWLVSGMVRYGRLTVTIRLIVWT